MKRLRHLLPVVLLAIMLAPFQQDTRADAAGPCSIYRSWNTGDQLTASDLTTSFTTVGVTNMITTCVDDYSSSVGQMQAVTDPYPAGVESQATTLAGEIERLRYVIKTGFGWTHWYTHAAASFTPRSYLAGFGLSNNAGDATNDIDIAVGTAKDVDNGVTITLASALIKRLDANWAVGTNQGGLDTGSIANGTYHVFAIMRPDTGVVDVLFSTSATAPTMPTNYTKKRRIGSIIREAAAIVAFDQFGDVFQRATAVLDVDNATPGTSANTATLSVPDGIRVMARMNLWTTNTGSVYISSLAVTDVAASTTAAPLSSIADTGGTTGIGPVGVLTNTSRQVRYRSNANVAIRIATLGWVDYRGRND